MMQIWGVIGRGRWTGWRLFVRIGCRVGLMPARAIAQADHRRFGLLQRLTMRERGTAYARQDDSAIVLQEKGDVEESNESIRRDDFFDSSTRLESTRAAFARDEDATQWAIRWQESSLFGVCSAMSR